MDENEMMWCQMECANDLLAPSCECHVLDLGKVSKVQQAGSAVQLVPLQSEFVPWPFLVREDALLCCRLRDLCRPSSRQVMDSFAGNVRQC